MKPVEIHFRRLDRVLAREGFLEEQMLKAEVHHLEVRTGFFDKLAVLAAGSLGVGVTLLGSQYEHAVLRTAIEDHIVWISLALLLVLLSLIACVLNNFFVSNAVTALSKQLEFVYKSAHELTKSVERPGYDPELSRAANERIAEREKSARKFQLAKEGIVQTSTYTGIAAVLLLILGYGIGFSWIIAVYSHTGNQAITQPAPDNNRGKPSSPAPPTSGTH